MTPAQFWIYQSVFLKICDAVTAEPVFQGSTEKARYLLTRAFVHIWVY